MPNTMFCPSRLILARKRRGYTKTRLAHEAGVSTRILTAYESGQKVPSSATLASLSNALRFPEAFFLAGEIEGLPERAASFRALTRLTAARQGAALGAGRLAIELHDWIADRFALPAPDVPRISETDPETAAQAVRMEWGIGERPVGNMIHLMEAHGVRVFSLAEDCVEVDAFSLWRGETPFAFLNTMKSAERSRMDAAHELGHLVLHWDDEVAHGRHLEREAQAFGSAFLMPRGSVLAKAAPFPTLEELISLKSTWKVAVKALVYRLHALELITDWHYRMLCIEISKRGFHKNEPNSIPRESSLLLDKVFTALRAEGLSRSDVARQLHFGTDELSTYVFGLIMTAVQGGGSPGGDDQDGPKLTMLLGDDSA